MGKGDKKTKKGKISSGSYGKTRKRKASTGFVATKPKKAAPAKETKEVKAEKPVAKKAPAKKPAAKKTTTKKAPAKK